MMQRRRRGSTVKKQKKVPEAAPRRYSQMIMYLAQETRVQEGLTRHRRQRGADAARCTRPHAGFKSGRPPIDAASGRSGVAA
jgi:hypothetical protein